MSKCCLALVPGYILDLLAYMSWHITLEIQLFCSKPRLKMGGSLAMKNQVKPQVTEQGLTNPSWAFALGFSSV